MVDVFFRYLAIGMDGYDKAGSPVPTSRTVAQARTHLTDYRSLLADTSCCEILSNVPTSTLANYKNPQPPHRASPRAKDRGLCFTKNLGFCGVARLSLVQLL